MSVRSIYLFITEHLYNSVTKIYIPVFVTVIYLSTLKLFLTIVESSYGDIVIMFQNCNVYSYRTVLQHKLHNSSATFVEEHCCETFMFESKIILTTS